MVTIKDIAKETGLAVATVSRVMNNRGYISEETRKKVNDAVKKLNYRPNELARSLQGKTSDVLGVIVPHIRHPYFSELVSNLEHAANKHGYQILLFNTQDQEEKLVRYAERCSANRVAGIVLCSAQVTGEFIEQLGVPVVAIERPQEGSVGSVSCDNLSGGIIAANTLIDAGCRSLLYVGSTLDTNMPADARSTGFEQVCRERGVSGQIVRADLGMYKALDYMDMLEQMVRDYPETDGVFASSDVIAAQVLQVCRKMNIAVPERVKVIGFDDVFLSTITYPQITTIHQPIQEMAEKAVDMLCTYVNEEKEGETIVFPVSLVKRASV